MAITRYTGDTDVIAKLGTTPEERGLTTEEFKAKFDQFAEEFVQWFNQTHCQEVDDINNALDEHKAESAKKHTSEVITNQYGSYTKSDNGQIIATAQVTYNLNSNSYIQYPYPVEFKSPPGVSIGAQVPPYPDGPTNRLAYRDTVVMAAANRWEVRTLANNIDQTITIVLTAIGYAAD